MCTAHQTQLIKTRLQKLLESGCEFFCAMDIARELQGQVSRREVSVELYKLFQKGEFGLGWIAQMVNPMKGVHYCVYRKNKAARASVEKYKSLVNQMPRGTVESLGGGIPYNVPHFVNSSIVEIWTQWQDGNFHPDMVVHPVPAGTGLIFWKMRNQGRVRPRLVEGTFLP